jgi:hypothetical protein
MIEVPAGFQCVPKVERDGTLRLMPFEDHPGNEVSLSPEQLLASANRLWSSDGSQVTQLDIAVSSFLHLNMKEILERFHKSRH